MKVLAAMQVSRALDDLERDPVVRPDAEHGRARPETAPKRRRWLTAPVEAPVRLLLGRRSTA